jgi:hypothetical protein
MSVKTNREYLKSIDAKIDLLIRRGLNMATKQDFEDLRVAVNDATNMIAARIQVLLEKLTAGGMSAMEEEEVRAGLQVAVEQLKVLGADPVDPVPPVV